MTTAATISAQHLRLLLAAAKLRRYTHGRTCQLCALSAGPVIDVDCAANSRRTRPDLADQARRYGLSPSRVTPLQRGHVALLYERVNRERGRREVLCTWGAGIRALRIEPRHVLNGGSAS